MRMKKYPSIILPYIFNRLQQVADAGISLILLVAFSLVLAGASVYIVNERVNGEKLQQNLCGVGFQTYWGVAFLWDFVVSSLIILHLLLLFKPNLMSLQIYSTAVLLAVCVFKTFNIPVYVAKDNLDGIVLLLMLYGYDFLTR
jgi:ABC-2 family transporter protein